VPSSLRIALTSSGSLDPRELDTPESLLIAAQLFDGLAAYDPGTGAAVPAVAERWDVRDGGRRFVFHLREGVTFHDGTLVTSDRFEAAWNRVADPGRPSPYAFLLESVEGYRKFHTTLEATELSGISAPEPLRFEVRLLRPWPDFVAVLGHPALSPVPPTVEDAGYSLQPIGNGPYRVTGQAAPGTPVSLERYDGYWGGQATIAQVVFTIHATPEEAWPRFLSGDFDVAPIPGPVFGDAVIAFGDQGLGPVGRVLTCGFNLELPRLRNRSLRTAVSMAIDREELVRNVYGDLAEPAENLVPPSIPGHQRGACGEACRSDLDRARALVASLPERARSLTLDFSDSTVGQELAKGIADRLNEAGFVVTPRPHLEEEFGTLIRDGRQELFCLVTVGDYPRQQAFLEPLLRSGSPDNHTGLDDEEINDLLARARATEDPANRELLYRRVERRALTLLPVVPLAWFRSRLAVKPYVSGFVLDPLGGFDVARLQIGR
jgi:ABC-type oligopeptide transport system substrate-binding subunit